MQNNVKNIGNKLDDFDILQKLGKGGYGFVAKVRSKIDKKIYAMKMIDFSKINDPKEKEIAKNEIKIIQNLNNPHINRFITSFSEGNLTYTIMEFMDNGDLKGYIDVHFSMKKPIPEEELWNIFDQSLSALTYIHKNNLIHRDIKPANLFMTTDKTIKIGDFGISAIAKKNKNTYCNLINQTQKQNDQTVLIGTPLYMSPEMYQHVPYGQKIDVYAMGCVFYELCFWQLPRMPMPAINEQGIPTVKLIDLPLNNSNNMNFYSKELINIIMKMIEIDQNKRPTSGEIFSTLKNEYNIKFLTNSSIDTIMRCLLQNQYIVDYFDFTKNQQRNDYITKNSGNYPISCIFIAAYNSIGNPKWRDTINCFRDALTFQNPSFPDLGEIEPVKLFKYIIEQLLKECNNISQPINNNKLNQQNLIDFDQTQAFNKFLNYFQNNFKSFISDNFFGVKKLIRTCTSCNRSYFLFEYFTYISFEPEIMEYSMINNSCCFEKCFEVAPKIIYQTKINCPICNNSTVTNEQRSFYTVPNSLIVNFERNNKNFNVPINFQPTLILVNIIENPVQQSLKLKGIIKKYSDENKKEHFLCLYLNIATNNWVCANFQKNTLEAVADIYRHNEGSIVMLIYDKI